MRVESAAAPVAGGAPVLVAFPVAAGLEAPVRAPVVPSVRGASSWSIRRSTTRPAAEASANTLLLQQVLAEPAWAKKLSDEDRRGLTALFWSNINPYGTFRLDMNERLDLPPAQVPRPRSSADVDDRGRTAKRGTPP